MKTSIYKTDKDNALFYTIEDYSQYMCNEGFYFRQQEDTLVFAKCISCKKPKTCGVQHFGIDKQYNRYYIRCTNKKIFDPISFGKNKISFIDKTCKSNMFIEVNEYIFTQYINFLKTKNNQWLKQAQRMLV